MNFLSFLTWDMVSGLLRHLLTAFGGMLVTWGIIDQGMAGELVGALMVIAGIIWSAVNKTPAATVAKAAAIVPIAVSAQRSVGIDSIVRPVDGSAVPQ